MLRQIAKKRLSLDSVFDVPCFACLSRKAVSVPECDPKDCPALNIYVRELIMPKAI